LPILYEKEQNADRISRLPILTDFSWSMALLRMWFKQIHDIKYNHHDY
jgi:hypothetical protein